MSSDNQRPEWVVGVDGCKCGWLAVFVDLTRKAVPVLRIEQDFGSIVDANEKPQVIAVDIPIGLPDFIDGPGRVAEHAVRPLLPGKASSVFSVPSRKAIYAEEFSSLDEAKKIARETSSQKTSFSNQSRAIFEKIRQVDRLLLARPTLRKRVYETHPELAFCLLNSGVPMQSKKKRVAGRNERIKVLRAAHCGSELLAMRPIKGFQWDDLLDAIVCSMVAERIQRGDAKPYPKPPAEDDHGLPIAIWA